MPQGEYLGLWWTRIPSEIRLNRPGLRLALRRKKLFFLVSKVAKKYRFGLASHNTRRAIPTST